MWAYDNRGTESHWIAIPVKQLRRLAGRFRRACSDPNSDARYLRNDAHVLYNLLVAPVEQIISSGRTLVVEADDVLNDIPFEALLDSHERYLAERVPVVSSFGLYYADALRSDTMFSKESAALIMAVSAPQTEEGQFLSPLPDAQGEASTVAAMFQSPKLLLGNESSLREVVKSLPGVSVFHFAGHAAASTSGVGLVLSDRLLSATSVRSDMVSNLRLAVLSACETELGTSDSPADPDSLVRFFLRAGVPHVVASRWRVDSAATGFFMQAFYAALLRGRSVSGSIQTAEAALREQAGLNHPYFWSAFRAFGRS